MLIWERKKPGFYHLIHRTKMFTWPYTNEEGIVAEIAKGVDGQWWLEYLDEKQGWTFNRCKSLRNAKIVAEECCKGS